LVIDYFKTCGLKLGSVFILVLLLNKFFELLQWNSIGSLSSEIEEGGQNYNLLISLLYGLASLILGVSSDLFIKLMSLKSTKILHDSMLFSILRSKMV